MLHHTETLWTTVWGCNEYRHKVSTYCWSCNVHFSRLRQKQDSDHCEWPYWCLFGVISTHFLFYCAWQIHIIKEYDSTATSHQSIVHTFILHVAVWFSDVWSTCVWVDSEPRWGSITLHDSILDLPVDPSVSIMSLHTQDHCSWWLVLRHQSVQTVIMALKQNM